MTQGECYTKLLHHLEEAQNLTATMAHLIQMQDSGKPMDALLAKGWLAISEMMRLTQLNVTKMAMGKLQ